MNKNRKDGKYIKCEDGIHAIMPYLMEKRCEAEVYTKDTFDITNLKKWLDKQNKQLDFKMTYFHALSSVFVKILYNRPLLNRFIQGHRTYERNEISIAFVAKDTFTDKAEEKMLVITTNDDEDAVDLAKRMVNNISTTREKGTNSLDNSLKLLTKMPRWLLRIVVRILRWLDYHGWVPSSLSDDDSNYATLLLSNLGSIKCNSCYHHLNNYGTNSIVITIGTVYEENGRYYVDISSTLDERIADGFYFAKSLKMAKYICENPKLLEEKLSSKIDIDF